MINISIRISKEMVNELIMAFQKTSKSGNAKKIRRILVLLDDGRGDGPDLIASQHRVGRATIYAWLKPLLLEGLAEFKQHKSSVINTILSEAIKLYRADFVAGFTLPNCSEFDGWQFFQAQHLRHRFAGLKLTAASDKYFELHT
jgi:hypothetical protein